MSIWKMNCGRLPQSSCTDIFKSIILDRRCPSRSSRIHKFGLSRISENWSIIPVSIRNRMNRSVPFSHSQAGSSWTCKLRRKSMFSTFVFFTITQPVRLNSFSGSRGGRRVFPLRIMSPWSDSQPIKSLRLVSGFGTWHSVIVILKKGRYRIWWGTCCGKRRERYDIVMLHRLLMIC